MASIGAPRCENGVLSRVGPDAFDRRLHVILGLPFDAVSMPEAIRFIRAAAASRQRCFFSTPNLNYLIGARADPAFRQSVLDSDLSLADGMPIVWLARLLGVPIRERVPGSGLVEALQVSVPSDGRRLRVFFFGGEAGLGETACRRLNDSAGGLACVGAIDPGVGSHKELSGADHLAAINAAEPDFLIVALGAKKGQAWIVANRAALRVPVVAHLGAVLKFIAGEVARAPVWVQRLGLEWLWRIREEPSLWRRYLSDGAIFAGMLCRCVLPLLIWNWRNRGEGEPEDGSAISVEPGRHGRLTIRFGRRLTADRCGAIGLVFKDVAAKRVPMDLDFAAVRYFDSAFLGQLLTLHAVSRAAGIDLRLVNLRPALKRAFRWHLCDFLLD